jgi:glucan phosphoethanolaminetransferase (alkaline phosphatase superfamily)
MLAMPKAMAAIFFVSFIVVSPVLTAEVVQRWLFGLMTISDREPS